MLGILRWNSIPSKGSRNTPGHYMLGILRWSRISSRGRCDAPSRFLLKKPELSAGLMSLIVRCNPVTFQRITYPCKFFHVLQTNFTNSAKKSRTRRAFAPLKLNHLLHVIVLLLGDKKHHRNVLCMLKSFWEFIHRINSWNRLPQTRA